MPLEMGKLPASRRYWRTRTEGGQEQLVAECPRPGFSDQVSEPGRWFLKKGKGARSSSFSFLFSKPARPPAFLIGHLRRHVTRLTWTRNMMRK